MHLIAEATDHEFTVVSYMCCWNWRLALHATLYMQRKLACLHFVACDSLCIRLGLLNVGATGCLLAITCAGACGLRLLLRAAWGPLRDSEGRDRPSMKCSVSWCPFHGSLWSYPATCSRHC